MSPPQDCFLPTSNNLFDYNYYHPGRRYDYSGLDAAGADLGGGLIDFGAHHQSAESHGACHQGHNGTSCGAEVSRPACDGTDYFGANGTSAFSVGNELAGEGFAHAVPLAETILSAYPRPADAVSQSGAVAAVKNSMFRSIPVLRMENAPVDITGAESHIASRSADRKSLAGLTELRTDGQPVCIVIESDDDDDDCFITGHQIRQRGSNKIDNEVQLAAGRKVSKQVASGSVVKARQVASTARPVKSTTVPAAAAAKSQGRRYKSTVPTRFDPEGNLIAKAPPPARRPYVRRAPVKTGVIRAPRKAPVRKALVKPDNLILVDPPIEAYDPEHRNKRPVDPENEEKTCLWGRDFGHICPFKAINDLELYTHIEQDHIGPAGFKVLRCLQPNCDYRTSKKDHIVSHQVTHCVQQIRQRSELRLFPCLEDDGSCSRIATRKTDLFRHIIALHDRIPKCKEPLYKKAFALRKAARAAEFKFGSAYALATGQEAPGGPNAHEAGVVLPVELRNADKPMEKLLVGELQEGEEGVEA
ncbi:hypothetical protein BJ508DRAFT_331400 [Ascobolus immersus RN42]|uniref:Uncharacterized protein n=1 Tax=Ascobolus immersus RN42 TaxID=1160509 RepID=A0A3N4HQY3_ASCIM|nr:hypothetical protein BJ508DRAFT_331400 [Ascobolus immersus RN42]